MSVCELLFRRICLARDSLSAPFFYAKINITGKARTHTNTDIDVETLININSDCDRQAEEESTDA